MQVDDCHSRAGLGDRNKDDIGVESYRSKRNIKAVKEVILSISTEAQIVGLDRDNRDCSETKKSIDLSASSCCLEEDFVTPASSFEMDGEGSCVSDADAQLKKKPWWITKYLFK